MTVAAGVVASIVTLSYFVRSEPRRSETPATHEPTNRVRARLEQLRAEHLDWRNSGDVRVQPPRVQERRRPHGGAADSDTTPDSDSGEASDTPFDEDADDIPAMTKIALEDPDPDRRVTAMTLLGASEDPEAIPVLAKALSDQDEEVRMAALEALSDFTDEPPVEAIQNALSDPAADIRFEALSVLADVGGAPARAAIEKALTDTDPDVRNLAEGILQLENLYEAAPAAAAGSKQPQQPAN
ncbi:MAG: HEAT repeat domain-containing protein [Candidatus Binatia bacterium]